MENKVQKTILEYNLINPGDTVLCGLSGGADSVALITVLNELKESLKINKLIACHINHNLRETAKRDEEFARNLCEKLNIDFYVKSVDISEEKKRLKVCEEEAGRIARYDFFHEIKIKTGADKIATAHNLNDQVETFFLRLLRGSSIDGLSGIKPMREDGVIRPLIDIKREEIEEYLSSKNQSYVTDETNLTTDYQRNKVRLLLLPFLKENFSFKEDVIVDTVALIKKDSAYIKKEVNNVLNKGIIKDGGLSFPLKELKETDDAILARVVKECLNTIFKISLSKGKIESVLSVIRKGKTGKEINLHNDIYAFVDYDRFIIKKKKVISKYCYDINIGDNVIKEAGIIINLSENKINDKNSFKISDCKNIKVRCRQPEDKVYIKKVGHKKVKDIFIDKKVSKDKRGVYPIITKDDEIIWIPGLYKNEEKDGKYTLSVRRMENEK